jgi:peptidoglycan/LPS O-acetylase OafA/YrhL
MNTDSTHNRIDYLDAVRGLAALSVVIYHILASHWDWMVECQLAMMVFNGSEAVVIFFVLSGLVLSYKLFQTDSPITTQYYKQYAVARFFRLYPAFLAMLVIYYLYAHKGEHFMNLGIQTFLHNPHFFWEEALLVRDHHTLFLPDWTLGIEIALSLLVPFLVIIARQNSRLLVYLLLASVFMGKQYISEFLLLFGFGVLIAQHFDTILHFKDTTKWWYRYRWRLLPFVLALYSGRHILKIYPLGETTNYFFDSIASLSGFPFTGTAAALLLLYIINTSALRTFFSNKIFVFLGQISYGVYLSHWLFNSYIMNHFDKIMQNYAHGSDAKFLLIYVSFSVTCSIIAGTLLYYCIERPFIRFGRIAAARITA